MSEMVLSGPRVGVGDGVAVSVGVGVAVGVSVGVLVDVGVLVGGAVSVGVPVSVAVAVAVWVDVGVAVGLVVGSSRAAVPALQAAMSVLSPATRKKVRRSNRWGSPGFVIMPDAS